MATHQLCSLYSAGLERWEAKKQEKEATAIVGYDLEKGQVDAAPTLIEMATVRGLQPRPEGIEEQRMAHNHQVQALKTRLEAECQELTATKSLLVKAKVL